MHVCRSALIMVGTLFLLNSPSLAEELLVDFVLSRDIAGNAISEAQAKFTVNINTNQKEGSAYLSQKLRDEAKPILDEINREVVKLVEEANTTISKKDTTDPAKQQALFDLNSKFDVLAAFTKSAVEFELRQKLTEWEKNDAKLKGWKIQTTYAIVRDAIANTFTLGTAIASQGVSGPIEIVDFLLRSRRIAKNLKDSLISEVGARKELDAAMLKYIDQISAPKPPKQPTTAERFRNLFSEPANISFENKLLLYEFKLTVLQVSLEKMSTQLTKKLDFQHQINDESKVAYEKACDELINRIATLSKTRLEEGTNVVQVYKQISRNGQVQQSNRQTSIDAQRKKDKELISKATDIVLDAASLVDPVSASLNLFEKACDSIVAEFAKPSVRAPGN